MVFCIPKSVLPMTVKDLYFYESVRGETGLVITGLDSVSIASLLSLFFARGAIMWSSPHSLSITITSSMLKAHTDPLYEKLISSMATPPTPITTHGKNQAWLLCQMMNDSALPYRRLARLTVLRQL